MQPRSFIAGLVCGGAAFAVVDTLVLESSESARPPRSTASDGGTSITPELVSESSEPPSTPRSTQNTTRESTNPQNDRIPTEQAIEAPAQPAARAEDAIDRASFGASATREFTPQNWFDAMRSRLGTEPRDVSWSPFSEQALRQFWGSHVGATQLTLDYIECGATICQIAVAGVDERANLVLQGMLYDMRQQPWYQFGQTGISSGNVGGRFMLIAEMRRAQSDE